MKLPSVNFCSDKLITSLSLLKRLNAFVACTFLLRDLISIKAGRHLNLSTKNVNFVYRIFENIILSFFL